MTEQLIVPRTVQSLGGVIQLPPTTFHSQFIQQKVALALQHLNAHRQRKLRLVEIVSATRQVINGVTYVFTVTLREEGSQEVKYYKITFFEVLGDDPSLEAVLSGLKRVS